MIILGISNNKEKRLGKLVLGILLTLLLLPMILVMRLLMRDENKQINTYYSSKTNPFSSEPARADVTTCDPRTCDCASEGGDCASYTDSAGCHGGTENMSNPYTAS